jgi:hypothetical protein
MDLLRPLWNANLEQVYQCLSIAGLAFGGAFAGVRCAYDRANKVLLAIRDQHIAEVENALDTDEPTLASEQVKRVVLKVVDPHLAEIRQWGADQHAELMSEIRSLRRDYALSHARTRGVEEL